MIYEYVIRLMGAGIAAVIYFMPIAHEYKDNTLTLKANLVSPVTEEINELVRNGFDFGIRYTFVIIVNDKKTFKREYINTLSMRNDWMVNNHKLPEAGVQKKMGTAQTVFHDIHFEKNDTIFIFVKATIEPDQQFKKITGLTTRVLWNHYVPRLKSDYIFKNGNLKRIEN